MSKSWFKLPTITNPFASKPREKTTTQVQTPPREPEITFLDYTGKNITLNVDELVDGLKSVVLTDVLVKGNALTLLTTVLNSVEVIGYLQKYWNEDNFRKFYSTNQVKNGICEAVKNFINKQVDALEYYNNNYNNKLLNSYKTKTSSYGKRYELRQLLLIVLLVYGPNPNLSEPPNGILTKVNCEAAIDDLDISKFMTAFDKTFVIKANSFSSKNILSGYDYNDENKIGVHQIAPRGGKKKRHTRKKKHTKKKRNLRKSKTYKK